MTNLCSSFTPLLGSHCSIHNQIETAEMEKDEKYQSCRQFSCLLCRQRFDPVGLRRLQKEEGVFSCPGCLHGDVVALAKPVTKNVAQGQKWRKSGKELFTSKKISLVELTLDKKSLKDLKAVRNSKRFRRSARSAKILAKTRILKYLQHNTSSSTRKSASTSASTITRTRAASNEVETIHVEDFEPKPRQEQDMDEESKVKTSQMTMESSKRSPAVPETHQDGQIQKLPDVPPVHSVLDQIEATLVDLVDASQGEEHVDARDGTDTDAQDIDKERQR